ALFFLWGISLNHTPRFQYTNIASSVPHMLDRHRLYAKHQIRRHARQLPRKFACLLLALENLLFLDPSAEPLLTLPHCLLCSCHIHLRIRGSLEPRTPAPRTYKKERPPPRALFPCFPAVL